MLSRKRSLGWKSCMLAGAIAWSGCASRVVLVGQPAPVPEPSQAMYEDLGRLQAWGCLKDGDPIALYLAEIEVYRCYVLSLRDEKDPDCD